MSNPLTFNNCIAPAIKNTTVDNLTILTADETTLASLTLNVNNIGDKVYFSADITFIFVNFLPEMIPADYLTFRVYRGTTLIFEKEIYCSNHAILLEGPSLEYVYEPTEANFFCVDTPTFPICDCPKQVTYNLTVQSTMTDTYTITPNNSTSTFIIVEVK
ncbi:hypothetical protein [Clostridium sp.]|uniref:hypothetical protein n=1 Tax=Clostridium sp. TaxID=1506 RepID=UPI003D6D8758